MINWRKFPDGTIMAPRRGKPPVPPEGYKATSNPYVFEPVLVTCEFRTTNEVKQSCCNRMKTVMWCNAMDRKISKLTCQSCRGSSEWVEDYLQKCG